MDELIVVIPTAVNGESDGFKKSGDYEDVKKALHNAAIAAEATTTTGLLEVIDPNDDLNEVTQEEIEIYKHSGPTGNEGEE